MHAGTMARKPMVKLALGLLLGRFLGQVLVIMAWGWMAGVARAEKPMPFSALEKALVQHLDRIQPELVAVNQDIWTYAELGLEEYRSAARMVEVLKKAGFRLKVGVSHMPTAFVAEYGAGQPVLGLLAEYDALPDLSQKVTGARAPVNPNGNGHGCGHSALGTASLGAALALKHVYEEHKLPGTIRLYGTPAEETVSGKVYMTLDGLYNDLDACIHWHPGTKNYVKFDSSKAVISAKFTFSGLAAHASGGPEKGRSALDGVELMNIGANYMREHIKETSRLHYVITQGGGAPNVVPARAEVWYYVRANVHEEAEEQFRWLVDIAEAAAKMSRTKVSVLVDSDCHELIPNLALSRVVARNFAKIGPPRFAPDDLHLARQLQEPLRATLGIKETKAMNDTLEPLDEKPSAGPGGSTDVGDISWFVPTSGLVVACFPAGSPGHSWQNVAASGSPLAHKGMMVAAKVMALTVADLLHDPKVLQTAKSELKDRLKDRSYKSVIPKGQKVPKSIR